MCRSRLMRYMTGERPEVGWEYRDKYGGSNRVVVADTLEGMGIVVPVPLYRPLSLGDEELRARAIADADVSDVVAEAQRALAEGFPGTALKLGRDLWIGNERQKQELVPSFEQRLRGTEPPDVQALVNRIASVRKE